MRVGSAPGLPYCILAQKDSLTKYVIASDKALITINIVTAAIPRAQLRGEVHGVSP